MPEMTRHNTFDPAADQRPADVQEISDASAGIYEAVATLEHGGHEPNRDAVIRATGLADDEVCRRLDELVRAGLLVTADESSVPVYRPASRGWSAVPDQAEGHHLH
jgi:hypothetical protein